ncbi:MAG: hypothetical protein IJX67_04560 [Oscillospiraceae bacterium]|nr:hypothetical protein [Oscillospiraceae bacterium]
MKTVSVIEYISTIDGYLGDICSDVYFLYLKKNDQAYNNLRTFLESWYDIESDKSISVKVYYSEDDYRECFDDIRSVIDRLLSNLVEKNYPSETFYSNLWDSINNDILFDSDLEKICAVLFVLLSSKIPYFQMEEALRMSDEEYWKVSREVDEQYKKAVFALNRGYDQRTEVASQIVRFFKEIEGETQQVVYIAKLIGYFRFEIHRLEEKIKELYSEIDVED